MCVWWGGMKGGDQRDQIDIRGARRSATRCDGVAMCAMRRATESQRTQQLCTKSITYSTYTALKALARTCGVQSSGKALNLSHATAARTRLARYCGSPPVQKETKSQRPSAESGASGPRQTADSRTIEAFQMPPVGISVHGRPNLSV